MKKLFYLWLLLLSVAAWPAKAFNLKIINTGTGASFRGLSVVDNRVVWASGSKGYVGVSTDSGNNWKFAQVKGYEQCDFRSIYAFDDKRAVIANAGSPAYILITSNSGQTWRKVYENKDSAAFFDGIGFWDNQSGIIYGDPLKGRLFLLRTNDGGNNWQELPETSRPLMEKDEASFAASGTTIRCFGKNKLIIATGGKVSRLLCSANKGTSWKTYSTPILQGSATMGIFSFAIAGGKKILIVGGDYKRDTLKLQNSFASDDGGLNWKAPVVSPRGYRECVEIIDTHTAITTGPSGTDVSYDLGENWQPLSEEQQFHVVRKSRNGNLIIMAGGGGKLAVVKL